MASTVDTTKSTPAPTTTLNQVVVEPFKRGHKVETLWTNLYVKNVPFEWDDAKLREVRRRSRVSYWVYFLWWIVCVGGVVVDRVC